MQKELPIWKIHGEIVDSICGGNRLVIVAPTGSGKTTQVPQMLLDSGRIKPETKIVVLQPRRVAARSVAARVAWERNVKLGDEVGYQIRFDDQTGAGTRICFVTEGILLRWLQDNRFLEGISVVVFDEFHERNLYSDVALGLVKQLQDTSRPDLKVLVMSATLDSKSVADYLGTTPGQPCPILISEGQTFPVEVKYLAKPDSRPVWDAASQIVEDIIQSGVDGDILVFMPGMYEINATSNAIRAGSFGEKLAVMALHGELSPEDQDRAFAPSPRRKVVVATNVAETSVTIDGIRHVVDAGQARVARFDAERGINTLFVEDISRASADQRKGRAGRTSPGICHRLWTESNHLNRSERNTPEIQRADLAEVVLLLHSLGVRKAGEFNWLDKPDPAAVERAEKLLQVLGAIKENTDDKGQSSDLTPVGRKMLRLPLHPRYSRILVEAQARGCVKAAALCAALVSGRDLLSRVGREQRHISEARELFETSRQSDFCTLISAFEFASKNQFGTDLCKRYGVQVQVARQVEDTYRQILGIVKSLRREEAAEPEDVLAQDPDALSRCLLTGFVDHLCVRRAQGTLEADLTEGRSGALMRESVVHHATMFTAATIKEVDGKSGAKTTLLGLATEVKAEWLNESYAELISSKVEHVFDRAHRRVAAIRITRFRDLLIGKQFLGEVDPDAAGHCLAEAHLKGWFELPLFNHEVKQFIVRVNMVRAVLPDLGLPAFDQATVVKCLSEAFFGITLAKEAQTTPLKHCFEHPLSAEQLAVVNEFAPVIFIWAGGKKVRLTYQETGNASKFGGLVPEAQVKLQECFQFKNHPRVCEGRVPLRLVLASPDGKKIDVTEEWPVFRKTVYPKLKAGYVKKFPSVAWP